MPWIIGDTLAAFRTRNVAQFSPNPPVVGNAAPVTAYDAVTGRLQVGGVEQGNTGWRRMALDATFGVVAAGDFFGGPNGQALPADSINLKRVGNVCYLGINSAVQPKQDYSASTNRLLVVPTGFRSDGTVGGYPAGRYGNNGSDALQTPVFFGVNPSWASPAYITAAPLWSGGAANNNWGGLALGGAWPKLHGGIWGTLMWHTQDAWPTTLPGTQGTPPFTG
jgi:hypothetical protein